MEYTNYIYYIIKIVNFFQIWTKIISISLFSIKYGQKEQYLFTKVACVEPGLLEVFDLVSVYKVTVGVPV